MRLAAARIFVIHVDEASALYESVLGLQVRARSPEAGYVVFASGTCELVVERVASEAPAEDRALVGRFTGLSFHVHDLDALYRSLMQRGAHFIAPPERQSWGGVLATLQDPAGNALQLAQYPSAPYPAFEGTAHLRGFARRWVPSALRASAARSTLR
jgi:uncharacterized glyoxalase superfamily protein PhnB